MERISNGMGRKWVRPGLDNICLCQFNLMPDPTSWTHAHMRRSPWSSSPKWNCQTWIQQRPINCHCFSFCRNYCVSLRVINVTKFYCGTPKNCRQTLLVPCSRSSPSTPAHTQHISLCMITFSSQLHSIVAIDSNQKSPENGYFHFSLSSKHPYIGRVPVHWHLSAALNGIWWQTPCEQRTDVVRYWHIYTITFYTLYCVRKIFTDFSCIISHTLRCVSELILLWGTTGCVCVYISFRSFRSTSRRVCYVPTPLLFNHSGISVHCVNEADDVPTTRRPWRWGILMNARY